MYRVSSFLMHFAFALSLGVVLATCWVNLSPSSYYDFVEWRVLDNSLPLWLLPAESTFTPQSIVTQGLMALFMFLMGKEMWEALIIEGGGLSDKRSFVPLAGVIGGTVLCAAVWFYFARQGDLPEGMSVSTGWPTPIGSDVVIAYVFGLLIFGKGHPALNLLLLICIGSDFLGLIILGISHPSQDLLLLGWLGLPALACLGVWRLFGSHTYGDIKERTRRRGLALWPYVLACLISYVGVSKAGLPPSLGLLPIIPAIPHANRAFGVFAEAEWLLHDPLNRFAHFLVKPLIVILFLFGLTMGGIDMQAHGPTTNLVLICAWIAKPLGFMLGVALILALSKGKLPTRISLTDMTLIAFLTGISFTVPVLSLDVALPGGSETEAARLGLAASAMMGPLVLIVSRLKRGLRRETMR